MTIPSLFMYSSAVLDPVYPPYSHINGGSLFGVILSGRQILEWLDFLGGWGMCSVWHPALIFLIIFSLFARPNKGWSMRDWRYWEAIKIHQCFIRSETIEGYKYEQEGIRVGLKSQVKLCHIYAAVLTSINDFLNFIFTLYINAFQRGVSIYHRLHLIWVVLNFSFCFCWIKCSIVISLLARIISYLVFPQFLESCVWIWVCLALIAKSVC